MKISPLHRWGALALALPLLAGCVSQRKLERPLRPAKLRPAALVDYYTCATKPDIVSQETVRRHAQYTIRRINLRSDLAEPEAEYDIGIDYFEPTTERDPCPAVLFLPILNEEPLISYPIARYLADRGIAVAVIYTHERGNLMDELDDIEPNLRNMVIRQRLALDWLLKQPGIDPGRIGVMGISMGGIKAALLKGIDERVGPAVFAMAGGNIPYIALNTADHGIAEQRRAVMGESHLKLHEIVAKMREDIRTDPLLVAPYVEPDDVLMFVTLRDKVVHTRTQEALQEALGMPRTFYLDTNHYTALVHIFMVRHRAYRFFEDAFGLKEPASGLELDVADHTKRAQRWQANTQ